MKSLAILIFIFLFSTSAVFAQKPKQSAKSVKKSGAAATAAAAVKTADEKEEFEKALAVESAAERIASLQKFLKSFPQTEQKNRALELIVSARAEIAEERLRAGDTEAGVKLFTLAAAEAPKPISEELFAKVVIQFPTNLFFRGQPQAALEVAKIIEEKAEGNARQLLALATFYIGVENADEAKRLAEKVLAVDAAALPLDTQVAAHQALGLANRLNFDLEAAAASYAKALELNPDSLVSKRSLAEMKRATGKTDEAVTLYREILEKDAADSTARTGLVLSLFNADKQAEAEAELARALEANPNNLFLLTGAAYWYAARSQSVKALEYAQKAVAVEPRYTWGQIALARALMLQRKPLEAEKALLAARQYGNFPTLDYELASVRFASGFYEEAAAELKKSFAVTKDGTIQTRLGYRVPKEAKSFTELLADERRASIFETNAADTPENAERLKSLLNFSQKINAAEPSETEIIEAADGFARGDDNAKTHRQLYAASRLLQKKIALPKVLELTQSAVKGVDSSLEVTAPSSAVLADELYDSRRAAAARGQLVIVPELPRQTLSNIIRGRIEEIAGWTLYYQEKPEEAAVRLKRAVGILPEKSAWWRSSLWRMGATLEAAGKAEEALDAYIKSYASGEPDAAKRAVIESLYQKINGTTDGLEERLTARPKQPVAAAVSFLVKKPESADAPAAAANAKTVASPSPSPDAPTTIAAAAVETEKTEIKTEETSATTGAEKINTAKTESSSSPPQPSPANVRPEKAETTTAPRVIVTSTLSMPQISTSPAANPPASSPISSPPNQPTETKSDAAENSMATTATKTETSPKTNEETNLNTTPTSTSTPEVKSVPAPAVEPTPEITPAPVVEPTPTPTTETVPAAVPLPTPTPTPEIKTEPTTATTTTTETKSGQSAPPTRPETKTIDAANEKKIENAAPDPAATTPVPSSESKTDTDKEGISPNLVASSSPSPSPEPLKTVSAESSSQNEITGQQPPPQQQQQQSLNKPKTIRSPIASPKTRLRNAVNDAPNTEKPIVQITDPIAERQEAEKKKTVAKTTNDPNKPLFDPIVINVPKAENEAGETTKTEPVKSETGAENEKKPAIPPAAETVEKSDEQKSETTSQRQPEEKPRADSAAGVATATPDDPILLGEQRARVVVSDPFAANKTPAACSLNVSQSAVSLLNNGGSLGILVGMTGDAPEGFEILKVAAASSSPTDVSVVLDPDIGRPTRRAFFILKSISRKTGPFTVTFDSPCGKKEVLVRVR